MDNLIHCSNITEVLSDVVAQIHRGQGVAAVATLCRQLTQLRCAVGEDQFESQVIPVCRQHELFQLIQQDPYSRRAFQKPRGYAGDAVMLDYVYFGDPPLGTTENGRSVFEGTTRSTNGRSVIQRMHTIADWINEALECMERPRVLSLAAGHLREAGHIQDWPERIGRWIAIDQDADSLDRIRLDYEAPTLETIQGSVIDFLRGKLAVEPVDRIYAAGLFDYLNDRIGTRTAATMFNLLRPGGEMLLANFTPQSEGRDFMDAFMDWSLIYRDEQQMSSLLEGIPRREIDGSSLSTDEFGNVLYLKAKKLGSDNSDSA